MSTRAGWLLSLPVACVDAARAQPASTAPPPSGWAVTAPASAQNFAPYFRAAQTERAATSPDGRISHRITMRWRMRVGRAPLAVYGRESAWGRQGPSFDAQVQAIAVMGYAVLRVLDA